MLCYSLCSFLFITYILFFFNKIFTYMSVLVLCNVLVAYMSRYVRIIIIEFFGQQCLWFYNLKVFFRSALIFRNGGNKKSKVEFVSYWLLCLLLLVCRHPCLMAGVVLVQLLIRLEKTLLPLLVTWHYFPTAYAATANVVKVFF